MSNRNALTEDERDLFIAGYCEAMLWANTVSEDEEENDRGIDPAWWQTPSEFWQLQAFDRESQTRIEEVCNAFLDANRAMLRQATRLQPNRTMDFHGHDLALTAAGHGTGFWDRGYPEELGQRLSDAAKMYAADAWFGEDGIVHYEG